MDATPTTNWRSGRIELFLLGPDDVTTDYVGWLNDGEVNRYLESRFTTHTLESTRAFVSAARANPTSLFLGIRTLGEGSRHIGNIKLGPIDSVHGLGEVGILIGDRFAWGKGFGSEAIRVLMSIAREDLGLRKLTAGCYAGNVGSMRAFEKAGFSIVGTRKDHFVVDNGLDDLMLMDYLL